MKFTWPTRELCIDSHWGFVLGVTQILAFLDMSYMTYLSLYHYIIKIVLFQIRLNFLYIFLISIIFCYGYGYISFMYTPLD